MYQNEFLWQAKRALQTNTTTLTLSLMVADRSMVPSDSLSANFHLKKGLLEYKYAF